MPEVTYLAPAKINLFLHITSKRADGYHELSSVFYPVKDLRDILEILPSTEFSFSSSGIKIPGEGNICTKAFEILKQDFEIDNVKIQLYKSNKHSKWIFRFNI